MEQIINHGANTSQNNNLLERKPIEGTPFTIIKQIMDNDKPIYFLVMGDHRLTEPTRTEEETLEKIITEHWKIITTVVAIIVEKTIEIQKINNQLKGPLFGSYTVSKDNFELPNGQTPTEDQYEQIKKEIEIEHTKHYNELNKRNPWTE